MNKGTMLLASIAALTYAGTAMASTASWGGSGVPPTITSSGSMGQNNFPAPSATPSASKITSVAYSAAFYNNGGTNSIQICWAPFATVNYTCRSVSSLSGTLTSGVPIGSSARMSFRIVHTLTGGTYPASTANSDTLTVNYSF